MPWLDAAAMEHQVREDCARATAEAEQPVGRNHPAGLGSLDCSGLEKSLCLPIWGEGMATRTKWFVEGKFANPPHPKDGYPLPECKDPRARRMLEFVVPILYPEKPAREMVTIGNTIFGAYNGREKGGVALVMRDMVRRLLTGVGKSKPTPICLYLLHLYIVHDVVQVEDKKVYMVGESFMQHEVDPEEDEESAGSKSSQRESLNSREI